MRHLLALPILCIGASLAAAEFDPALQGVRFFAYQLQNFDTPEGLQALSDSHYDLLVIDQTRSLKGCEDDDSASTVAALHATFGSSVNPKKVACYLDAGQAEDFRWYWQEGWTVGNPSWILAPDPDWPGDYPVKFWDPEWKALMKQDLAMIIADGYDGAYLDWMEIYAFEPLVQAAQAEGKDPRAELIAFIRELRDYARSLKPDFFFIAQNAAELGASREWLNLFSGIGHEDIWFTWGDGSQGDEPQDPELTAEILSNLAFWKAAGRVVFTIEYAQEPANVATAYANGKVEGFITHVTTKELDQLSDTAPPDYRVYNLTGSTGLFQTAQLPTISPDGQWIAFTEKAKSICKIGIGGLDAQVLFSVTGYDRVETVPGSSWNASVGRIFFTQYLNFYHEVWSINPDGSVAEPVIQEAFHDVSRPTLSPDGMWIAYESYRGRYWHIYKRNLDTGEEVMLSGENTNAWQPNWSPTGDSIVFGSDVTGNWDIWLMDIWGGNQRNLTRDSAIDWAASFSPDGKWITFVSDGGIGNQEDIYIISLTDPYRNKYQITRGEQYQESPSISSDGKTLTFSSGRDLKWDIWTMPIYLPPPSEHERPLGRP